MSKLSSYDHTGYMLLPEIKSCNFCQNSSLQRTEIPFSTSFDYAILPMPFKMIVFLVYSENGVKITGDYSTTRYFSY